MVSIVESVFEAVAIILFLLRPMCHFEKEGYDETIVRLMPHSRILIKLPQVKHFMFKYRLWSLNIDYGPVRARNDLPKRQLNFKNIYQNLGLLRILE